MRDARRNLMVGTFVLLGLAALAVLIVLFGKVPTWILRGNTYDLAIRFESVAGVREGTLVTMGGKTIGRVREIEFVDPAHIDRGVRVIAAIEREYRLPADCRAVTAEAILGMGRPAVRIVVDAPVEGYLPEGAGIPGRTIGAVETIFPAAVVDTLQTTATRIGEAAAALRPVLLDLHEIMERRSPGDVDAVGGKAGNLSSAAARLDELLRHFNQVLGDPAVQSQLKEGIANLHQMSQDGRGVVERLGQFAGDAREVAAEARTLAGRANETMQRADEHLERVARSLTENLDKASMILDGLAAAALQMRRGEGTLGRFVQDERLYESMLLTFQRLSEATEEFRVLVKEWQKGKVRVGL